MIAFFDGTGPQAKNLSAIEELYQILEKDKHPKRGQKKNKLRCSSPTKRIIDQSVNDYPQNRREGDGQEEGEGESCRVGELGSWGVGELGGESVDEGIGQIGPGGIDRPVGKVKKTHRPINDGETNGYQRINTPRNNAINSQLLNHPTILNPLNPITPKLCNSIGPETNAPTISLPKRD